MGPISDEILVGMKWIEDLAGDPGIMTRVFDYYGFYRDIVGDRVPGLPASDLIIGRVK